MERLRDGCLPKLNADVDTLKRELEQVYPGGEIDLWRTA